MNTRHRYLRNAVLVMLLCVLIAGPSQAATLNQVTGFTTGQTSLEMFLYVPDNIKPNPPVLVAIHYCTGTGPMFHEGSQFSRLAEQYGFIVIYPSATREGRCFDVASKTAVTRRGGDPVAIKAMLDHVLDHYQANADEVYVAGVSSGAMMTNVLLALYPGTFKAGAAYAGVPYTCFATEDESGWSNACSEGRITSTAAEWGDLVRDANPGYEGPYPRIQMWHGTEDEGLSYVNFEEAVKLWTNIHGFDVAAPAMTDSPAPGYTRRRYGSTGGQATVEAISLQGVGHDLPIDAFQAIRFFGLAQPNSWRPFSDVSPWNTPIPANAPIDQDSSELIADFAGRGALYINMSEWSVPVYYVDSNTTSLHDVGDLRPGIYGRGFEPPRAIPIPEDASPSLPVGGDEHMAIVDIERNLEWGMWQARKVDGQWMSGLGALTDLKGTGVAPPWNETPRELDAHRARASGFPLIAGLIRVDEVKAGYIPHALVFAYDMVRTEHFIPPASTAQASTAATRNNRDGMPMGAHIYLDASFDVESSDLGPAGKTIARALQKYGAYLGDYAGANVLYAESSPEALKAWEGLLSEEDLLQVFTPHMIERYFRLLDMGEVRQGQNFSQSKMNP